MSKQRVKLSKSVESTGIIVPIEPPEENIPIGTNCTNDSYINTIVDFSNLPNPTVHSKSIVPNLS